MQSQILTRRNLPHWYVPGAAHFLTYRLFGTVPREVLDAWRATQVQLLSRPVPVGTTKAEMRARVHKQMFAIYDEFLDRNREVNTLTHPRVASMIRSNLYHHHGTKYFLLAYCIMGNHVHVLLTPRSNENPIVQAGRLHYGDDASIGEQPDSGSPLAEIMHSLKSYTAHEANKILKRTGQFWQHESYDHWIRDDDELQRVIEYICGNPVKAGLVDQPQDWFWCSCHDRYLIDGEVSGWLPP